MPKKLQTAHSDILCFKARLVGKEGATASEDVGRVKKLVHDPANVRPLAAMDITRPFRRPSRDSSVSKNIYFPIQTNSATRSLQMKLISFHTVQSPLISRIPS